MSDKWLFVGLGNPGKQYEKTRHNVGFQVIHRLAEKSGISGKGETKFRAVIGKGNWAGRQIIMLQPLTYMNLSGESVRPVMDYYEIDNDHLVVIYDDKDLPFGKLRIRANGSAGSHNGMKSIIQHLGGNQNFARLRIGIGTPAHEGQALHDHVLSKFAPEEQAELDKILDTCVDALETLITKDIGAAMTSFNGGEK